MGAQGKEPILSDVLTGVVQNGVFVLDATPGRGLPPDGTRVRVEVAETSCSDEQDDDPLAVTRAFLLMAAREAETIATPLPPDLAENHDRYAHGKPRT